MSVGPGTRLGPYEIQSAIGAGGMGEVYRARDTRLKRDVALKILPESFAADPERLARFQREAEVLASLNHPHIATIHGIEESAGTRALVMELVDGEMLAEAIARGPMPVEEALRIAKQIAEGLEAAHEQGIIHRDLKPANIKITPDGQVKVLDFGLAKLSDASAAGAASALSMSPTITSPALATRVGVLLGTAAYMSPEQARGREADRRSDVWAFGCVLYEMFTGKRAFDGEDVAVVLASVIKGEPDWAALPSEVPKPILMLLRGCLEKERRSRVADLGTVSFVLTHRVQFAERVVERVEVPVAAEPVVVPRPPIWRRAMPIVTLCIGALLAGGSVWLLTRSGPPGLVRTEVTTTGAAVLSINGNDRDLAITPDGSRLIYRGNGQLLVRALDQLEPDVLSGLGTPRGVFVSPDGQWIGFFDGNPLLKKVAITGGPPVTVARVDGNGARGATWGPDGTIVFATNGTQTGLQRVSAAGGDPTVLTKPQKGEADHYWPEFLPGGRAVLFTITAASGTLDNAQIAALDLETGTYKVLVRGGSHAYYVPTGHLVYGAGGTLRAVPFDLNRLEVTGTPVPVLEGVVTTPNGGVDAALAANGTMVYVPGRGVAGPVRSLVWVDRMGREEALPAPVRAYQYPRISPDGTRVALDIRDQEQDIWIWDFARQTLTRLTFDQQGDQYPVWTPDSRRVIFSSQRAGAFSLFWQAADGTGAVERLTESSNSQASNAITPDGSRIVFREDGQQHDLMLVPLSSPRRPQPLIQTMFGERNAEIAPHGRWLAYESNESGRLEIYVRPFPDVSGGRWQVSTGGGRTPLWSRNGQELFYVSPDGTLMGVRVEAAPSWRSSTPARVLQGQYLYGTPGNGRTFDIGPDGRRFLMIKQGGGGEAAPQNLVVVQNWFEELKRLVPVN